MLDEKKYKTIVEQIEEVSYVMDNEGNLTYISPQVERYGFKADELQGSSFMDLIHPDDLNAVLKDFRKAVEEGVESVTTFRVKTKNAGALYFEKSGKVLRDDNDQIIGVTGVIRDITARIAMRDESRYQADFEEIVATISTNFIGLAPDEIDDAANDALRKIGEFTEVDRSYVFLISDEHTTMSNTYEWCAEGVKPQIDNLQELPVDSFPWGMEKLNCLEEIHIPRVSALPPEASAEKEILQEQNIQSVAVIPMSFDKTLTGFIGFCSVRTEKMWTKDEIRLLRMVAETFTNTLRHKQTDEALIIEGQTRFKELTELLPQSVFEVDLEGNILYINRHGFEALGYTQEDFDQGINAAQTVIPEDRERMKENISKLFTGEKISNHEYTALTKEGNTFPCIIYSAPIIREGKTVGIRGIIVDITDRKETEEELLFKNALLEAQNETTLDGILLVNAEGKVNSFNKHFIQLWEIPQQVMDTEDDEKLLQYAVTRLKEPAEFIDKVKYLYAHKEEKSRDEVELKDGRILDCYSSPLIGANDKYYGRVWYFRDITDQKLAKKKLRDSEKKFRTITSSARDAIVMMDNEGKTSYWNEAAERIFGYTKDETIGKDLHRIIAPEKYREAYRKGLNKFWKTGQGAAIGETLELSAIRKDGTEFPIEISLAGIKMEDGWNAVGIMRDITDRKQVEKELIKAKNAAENSNRAKSEFLANMSHEIRTPMNAIMGMTDIVLDTDLTEVQKRNLNMVSQSSHNLLNIINDILDFSRIEAERLELNFVDFSLRDSIGNTMRTFANCAQSKRLELAYSVKPNVPDALVGDKERLQQVLINLVGNAVKFTKEGKVIVRVEQQTRGKTRIEQEVREGTEHIRLHFSVSDTGMGISPEKKELIFKAFRQVDSSIAREYGGTGLGLAISSKLVKMMNGGISVESEVGKGSTFHFIVELDVADQETETILPDELIDLPVLVVDDSSTSREFISDILRKWKMKPNVARNGYAGLAELKSAVDVGRPYPLAIIDQVMPGTNGLAVAALINKDPEFVDTSIIMLTSYEPDNNIDRSVDISTLDNVSDSLIKPVIPSKLLKSIMTALKLAPTKAKYDEADRRLRKESQRPLHILLAEDDKFNQELAIILLEKEGHTVVVANNGKEVLDAWKEGEFDLVLMDVQMPELDGLEATSTIREREEDTGKHIPIIAMTAHAMSGDQERFLEADMDGYVSKPIDRDKLFLQISEVVSTTDRSADLEDKTVDTAISDVEAASSEIFDKEEFFNRIRGDMMLAERLTKIFFASCPDRISAIRDAIERGDSNGLMETAHALKGAAGNLSAKATYDALLKLEKMGDSGDLTHAEDALAELEKELERLKPLLEELQQSEN